jgi:hypothetical protein
VLKDWPLWTLRRLANEFMPFSPLVPRGRAAFELLARMKLQDPPSGQSFNPQPSGEDDLPFVLA